MAYAVKTGETWTWRPAPDITSTCWQHLNLASVWNSGRISADYTNGLKSWLNTSNCFIRTTCVFPPYYYYYYGAELLCPVGLTVRSASRHGYTACFVRGRCPLPLQITWISICPCFMFDCSIPTFAVACSAIVFKTKLDCYAKWLFFQHVLSLSPPQIHSWSQFKVLLDLSLWGSRSYTGGSAAGRFTLISIKKCGNDNQERPHKKHPGKWVGKPLQIFKWDIKIWVK